MPGIYEVPAEAVEFDDGFVPSGTSARTRLLRQPPCATLPPGLTVVPEAISGETAMAAYNFTVNRPNDDPQWGTYLTFHGEEGGKLQLQRKGKEPEVRVLSLSLSLTPARTFPSPMLQAVP